MNKQRKATIGARTVVPGVLSLVLLVGLQVQATAQQRGGRTDRWRSSPGAAAG